MANISPGVYTKIIDLSLFVQVVPASIGLICGFSRKGRDNELIFVGSRSEFVSEWGEPNITDYTKNYGQGPYIAYNHLGESGSLYWMRLLPDDAAFSNFRIDTQMAASDATASVSITYVASLNTVGEIQSNLETVVDNKPLAFLYPIGRGDYYNALSVRFLEFSNPTVDGVYTLDIYEKQTDGEDVIIESFAVSFDPNAMDNSGDSLFITSILETYSSVLRAEMELSGGEYTAGYELIAKNYDNEIGNVDVDLTAMTISDDKQDFSDWEKTPATGTFEYTSTDITYKIRESKASVADAFSSDFPVPLRKGSEGALRDDTGAVDTAEAETLLEQGYSGIVDETMLDPELVYFSLVYDAGYPADVKTAISSLCQTRKDCVGIMDNGDNSTSNNAIATRNVTNTFNNFYTTLYEPFNKVSDPFTGEDIWFSPIYHMSYLIPRNDNIAEIWFAAAGFNRGAIDSIKDLRYNPRLGQRDQMYLKQLNPIVKFAQGYVVWGQLTTQAKPSALQDLNIVRLVLFCKRALEQFCRFFIFEQNDQVTWGQVASNVTDFLEVIKNRRGLDAYQVDVGATDYERKTKVFHVNVTLTPTRVVERIELNFFIK
jgi:phage tail sheath protein FI